MTTTNRPFESFNINSSLTLMCTFMGIPSLSLKWLHNGLPLSSSSESITITNTRSQSGNTSFLTWMNAPMDAAGVFSCVATNYLGSRSKLINVLILGNLVIYCQVLLNSIPFVLGHSHMICKSYGYTRGFSN